MGRASAITGKVPRTGRYSGSYPVGHLWWPSLQASPGPVGPRAALPDRTALSRRTPATTGISDCQFKSILLHITNFVVTERGFRMLFNRRPVVSFSDSRLGNMMIEGFIGAHPLSEDLRAALLGVR
jgi:hypothetical protein